MSAPPFSGAVLAGGASRRMGTDKAVIVVGGVPMLERAVQALVDAGAAPVLVVGGEPARAPARTRHEADARPGGGPLAALVQVLEGTEADLVAVLACDLPAVSGVEILRVVEALAAAGPDVDAAVSDLHGVPQWLHGVWRRAAAPALRAALESGVSSVHGAAERLHVVPVAPLDPATLVDLDRPEDLARYAAGTDEQPGDG